MMIFFYVLHMVLTYQMQLIIFQVDQNTADNLFFVMKMSNHARI